MRFNPTSEHYARSVRAIAYLRKRVRPPSPASVFWSPAYMRHTQRRQEHLASLGLSLSGYSVLEVGAGIGDHTSFFLDRGCTVTITDGRPSNLGYIQRRFPERQARLLDLEDPDPRIETVDAVYCYGTLYHLGRPAEAVEYLAARCRQVMLVETCVSMAHDNSFNPEVEDARNVSQATSGLGCRPTRRWVWTELARRFPYVYATTTQPWHDEFPLDWSLEPIGDMLTRAVFVASRNPIDSPFLTTELPVRQTRH